MSSDVYLSFFFSSRRRHTRWPRDWSSDVCSSDLRRRALLDRFVTVSAIWEASEEELQEVQGIGPALAAQITAALRSEQATERSEERRVGKEGGTGGGPDAEGEKDTQRRGRTGRTR